MTAAPRSIIRRDEAEEMAAAHRAAVGDDVVRHDPEDHGNFFACDDCDWLVVYVPHHRAADS
jgi:hypothetical protein